MAEIKKYVAECIGTFVLVLIGCGTAMLVGCDAENGGGYVLTAFAFGLVIVGMAYCIGNISGCHINPAVSLAVLISGGMSVTDFFGYVISQIIGAFLGSAALGAIFSLGNVTDQTGGFGANGLGGLTGGTGDITGQSVCAGLIVEFLLTFIFVLTILGVTSKKFKHGSFGGIIIGFALTMVHIFGIGLTGTSVNPARSIGPAIASAINGNSDPLSSLWVFIVGPFIGAALAACIYKFLESGQEEVKEAPAPAPAKKNTNNKNSKNSKKK